MKRTQFTPEKIIGLLRQAEAELARGKRFLRSARGLGISEQSYYRWRSEYDGLKLEQAPRAWCPANRASGPCLRTLARIAIMSAVVRCARRPRSAPAVYEWRV